MWLQFLFLIQMPVLVRNPPKGALIYLVISSCVISDILLYNQAVIIAGELQHAQKKKKR